MMNNYDKLAEDFFKRVNPLNPLHYYRYKYIVRDKRKKEKTVKADSA